jgi:hypothetical protein
MNLFSLRRVVPKHVQNISHNNPPFKLFSLWFQSKWCGTVCIYVCICTQTNSNRILMDMIISLFQVGFLSFRTSPFLDSGFSSNSLLSRISICLNKSSSSKYSHLEFPIMMIVAIKQWDPIFLFFHVEYSSSPTRFLFKFLRWVYFLSHFAILIPQLHTMGPGPITCSIHIFYISTLHFIYSESEKCFDRHNVN